MAKFSYKAVNDKGRPVRGVIAAANETDLFNRLNDSGLALVSCKQMNEKGSKIANIMAKRVKVRDMVQMFVHMEQLQKAGVPLLDTLSDVRDTTESTRLRDVMSDIYNEVSEGSSLSGAISKHPTVFGPIFISLIAAGEETGNLTNAFSQLIKHLKWTDAMNSKVKKATRYPKILLVVVIGVIWLMMSYVVPQVVGFLKDMGQVLPPVTTALIATSEFFTSYFFFIVGFLIFLYFFLKFGREMSEGFRYRTDYMVIHSPVVGVTVRKISLSRFCQTFAILFSSGLEILKCLEAAKQTAGNLVIGDALDQVKLQVQEGSTLSSAFGKSGEFPSLVVRMVRIGEESGNLTGVLEQVTEFYDKDVNEAVDAMISMIEPVLTVVLGGFILWIAAAVFGPIYDSIGKMGG
jgi:type IV pilus assembly protein PilC